MLRVRAQLLARARNTEALRELVRQRRSSWRVFEALALQELSRGHVEDARHIARSLIAVRDNAPPSAFSDWRGGA
jgi:hypothetical protein